jgi:hypothetical protein
MTAGPPPAQCRELEERISENVEKLLEAASA